MRKCCLNKYLKKKQNQQQQHAGQGYSASSYNSYYQQPQYSYGQQQSCYQSQPQYNYNYGWTSYQNTSGAHNYGYIPAPRPIIYEIRDRSPSSDDYEYYEEDIHRSRRSRSTRREKSCHHDDITFSKSVSRVRRQVVPAGPPPPPQLPPKVQNNKSDKNIISADEYRPVYSPNEKLTLAQYSDTEPSFGAGYHQSSIQPLSENFETGSETLPSDPETSVENINPPTPEFTRQNSNSTVQTVVVPIPDETPPTPILTQSPILITSQTEAPFIKTLERTPSVQSTTQPTPTQTPTLTQSNLVFYDRETHVIESPQRYSSEIEKAIHSSNRPIEIEESESIEIPELGVKGIWINKSETDNWKGGEVPLSEYKINIDQDPEKITLKYVGCVERIELKAIKFLKPLPRDPPGDLIITQLPDYQPPEAPPIIIRQLAPEHCDPKPQIIREKPPVPPESIPTQEIVIPGKRLEPPPRRVIVEKLAKEPDEIKGTTVERWLPYERQQRRVIFNRAPEVKPVEVGHNIEYVWEPPCVEKRTEFQNLGIEYADPVAYTEKFNGKLIKSKTELPEFALQIEAPNGVDLNTTSLVDQHNLVGDLQGLKLIDLDKEGLSMYKKYVN